MHEMQTIVPMCMVSVSLSVMRGYSVHHLPNHFGLLFGTLLSLLTSFHFCEYFGCVVHRSPIQKLNTHQTAEECTWRQQ